MNNTLPASLRLLFFIFLSSVSINAWAATPPGSLWIATPEETRALGLQPLDLGNGRVFMPRHDGVHYFIDPTDAPVAEGEKPSITDIEKAAASAKRVAIDQSTNIGGGFLSQSLTSLPLTLGIANGKGMKTDELVSYDVTLMSMTFRPSGLLLTVGIKFKLPGQFNGQEQYIYLGAKNLSIPYQGGTLSGDLLLIETGNLLKNVYLGEKVFFELGPATSLGFDCGNLKDFHLNGLITLPPDMLIPENNQGQPLSGRVSFLMDADIRGWDNVYIGIKLASGFRLPVKPSDFPEDDPFVLGFQPLNVSSAPTPGNENIILDLSSYQSPPKIATISCFSGAGNDWRGIFIQDMALRLPSIFKNKDASGSLYVNIQNLAVSDQGFFASVSAQNLLPIENGRIGDGFEVSVDNLALSVCNTEIKAFGIDGSLRLPIMRIGESLTYRYYRSPNSQSLFSIGLKDKKGFSFDAFGATATLCDIAGILTKDKTGETQLSVMLSGGLQISKETDALNLNFGFQKLKVNSKAPFIDNFLLTIGNSAPCDPATTSTGQPLSLNMAGMELSLGNLQVGMLDNTLKASADISVNMDDKISGTGHFVVAGDLLKDANSRYYFTNTQLGIDEVYVRGDFSVFKFEGGVKSINNPSLGTGFSGVIGFKLKLGEKESAGGNVQALFARKDNFKYWFLDASMDLSPSIPLIGPLSLKALNGAAYKNVSFQYADLKTSPTGVGTTASGLAFTPKEGSWGFRAGLLMDVKDAATVGGMIEVVGQSGYGIKKVSLFADLQLVLPNSQKPTIVALKNKMGAISASLDMYLGGETLSQNQSVTGDNFKGAASSNKNLTMAALKGVDLFGKASQDALTADSRIGASLLVAYKVDAHELIGLIYPDIHIGMNNSVANFSLQSTGYGIFYFSPTDWYIHMGKQAWDDRLGLKLNAYAGTTSISAFVNGYFMLGSGIGKLPTPHVPNEFASLFDTQTSAETLRQRNTQGEQQYDNVVSGNGIALGAAAGLSINFSLAKIIECTIDAGAGFDVVVSDLANCEKQEGWGDTSKKYSAQGQLYGYCSGNLKVKSVTLAGFGAGFSLKASVPKPFLAEGRVKVFVKIWFIKADLTVKVKVGDMCDTPDLPPPTIAYKFVEKTAPLDGATNVSPYTNINVMYNDTIRSYSDDTGVRMSSHIEIYGPGNQKIYDGSQIMQTKDMGLTNQALVAFPLTTALAPGVTYQLKVTSTLADNDGAITNENGQPIQEAKTFTFTTGGNSRKIEKADVAIYPVDNQYNVYPKNWNGLLVVDATVVDKLKKACSNCQYTLELNSPNGGKTFSTPITNLNNQSFDLASLAPNTQYTLRISSQGTESGAPTTSTLTSYEGHTFRTSQFATFQDKIAAYNSRKTTEVVSPYGGIPVFNLSLSNELSKSDFEPFSKEEIAENVLFQTPEGDWFARFNEAMTTVDTEGSTTQVNYWNAKPPTITYTQQRQPYLLAGVPQIETTASVQTGPLWTLKLFEQALYDYADARPMLYHQESNGIPIFDGTYRIPVDYDPLRKHPKLRSKLGNTVGYLTFSSPSPIDLNTQQLTQYTIAVACQPDARDHQPIAFSVKVLTSKGEETTTLDIPLKVTIKNPAWVSEEDSKETGIQEKEVIAIAAGAQSFTYTSTFVSQKGCPVQTGTAYALTGADPAKTFVARKYALQVTNSPYPAYQPYITVKCEVTTTPLPSLFDNEVDGQLRVQGARNTYSAQNHFQQNQNNYYIRITAFEDQYQFNYQTMKEPTQITLSNGKGCQIPAGQSSCLVAITAAEFGTCNDVTATAGPATTGGGNEASSSNRKFYPLQVSNTFASLESVCGATTDHTLFAPSIPLNVGSLIQQDSGRAGISPVTGYYLLRETNQVSWIYTKDGKVTQKGSCSVTPYIKQECVANSAYTPTNGASRFQLQLTLYTSNTQNQLFIPNYPIRVTLSNGQEQTIPAGTSGKVTIDLNPGGTCAYLAATFPDNGMTYNPITPSGCLTLPPAPTLSVSPSGPIGYGQTVTLTASGCSGEVVWIGMNAKGSSLAYRVQADSRLRAICIQNGCVSPEAGIDLKLVPFTVASNLPNNEVCRTRNIMLTASGCGGTVNWQPGNLNGTSITVSPTETTVYSTSCTLADGTVRLGESITVKVNDTPNAPILSSSISVIRNSEVCITANSVVLTASTCNLGSTSWYSAIGTETPALIANSGGQVAITVTPTKTTAYFVTCHTDKCEGDPSNTLTVTVIDPPIPVISTNTYLNTICRNYSTTLSATNCPYTVVWSDGQTGNTITVSPQKTTIYTASCTKDNWCSGIASTGLTINVVDQNALIAPVLSAKAVEFCSYESTQLSASAAYTGRIEWTTPANTSWHVEGDYLTSLPAQHAAGNYTYQVRSNLNGCFRPSNTVGLTVNPKPDNPTLGSDKANHTICFGDKINLTANCSLGNAVWDNLSSTQLTGLSVGQHTYYALCKSAKNCSSDKSSSTVTVNPIPAAPSIVTSNGNPICAYEETTISAINCSAGGVGGTISWKHNPSLTVSIEHVNQTSTYAANCTVLGCVSNYSSDYTLTVNPKPGKPGLTVLAASICSGTNKNITFTASGCSGTYKWSDGNTSRGTVLTVSNPGNYSYWVKCVEKNCESDASDTQSSVINQTPGAFTVEASVASLCTGNAVTLTAKNYSGTVRWLSENNVTGESTIKIVSQVGSYTFRAESYSDAGCVGPATTKAVTVYPYPSAPNFSVSQSEICSGDTKSIAFTASGCSGTYQWSDNNNRGNQLGVSSPGSYAYWVKCEENGCVSGASSTQSATIHPTPGGFSIDASVSSLCSGNAVTLSASGYTGTVRWVSEGNETGSSITKNPTNTHTYTAESVSDKGCISPQAQKSITVYPYPSAPGLSISSSEICSGDNRSISFNASGCNGNYEWSDGNTNRGGSIGLSSPGSYSYWVKCNENGCVSGASSTQSATIKSTANAVSLSSDKTDNKICTGESITINVSGCDGTVYWLGGGTGESRSFSPGSSATYYAYCAHGGYCDSPQSSIYVTVNPKPAKPSISSSADSYCKGSSVTLSAQNGQSGDIAHWSSGQSDWAINTGQGTYTVYFDRDGCSGERSEGKTIVEYDKPSAPSFDPASPSACPGATVSLTAKDGGIFWGTSTGTINASPDNTYYAARTANGCTSDWASVKVNTTYAPDAPSISVGDISITASGDLIASGCTGGTISWENGQTGNTLSVSSAGTYKATCTISTDCGNKTSTASGKVTKLECNGPSVSVNDISINEGSTGTLTAIGCGGTVTWSTGETGLSITVNRSGTYKATCTISTDCGDKSSSDDGTVTVIPPKPKPSGNFAYNGKSILCDGESSTPRSFAGCDGGTIEVGWKTGGIYTDNNLPSGEYYAICRKSGFEDATTSFGINASSRPYNLSISKSQNGTNFTLSASASGANSYKWNTGSTASSITVNPASETTYTVRAYSGYSQDGCESSSEARQTISVSVPCTNPPTQPSVSANVMTICGSGSSALTAKNCNGRLSWSTEDGNTSSITVNSAGTYTVYCSTDNCPSTSADVKIGILPILSISQDGSYLTAHTSGCTTGITWYHQTGSGKTNISSSSSVNTGSYGPGGYSVECSNNCGTNSAGVYINN